MIFIGCLCTQNLRGKLSSRRSNACEHVAPSPSLRTRRSQSSAVCSAQEHVNRVSRSATPILNRIQDDCRMNTETAQCRYARALPHPAHPAFRLHSAPPHQGMPQAECRGTPTQVMWEEWLTRRLQVVMSLFFRCRRWKKQRTLRPSAATCLLE